MILFHGTSNNRLGPIIQDGIKPRGRKKGNWFTNVESNTQMVYLTSQLINAQFYAVRAGIATNTTTGALLLIDPNRLDHSKLRADENFYKEDDFCSFEKRRKQRVAAGEDVRWQESLKQTQLCAYRGIVTPEAIIEYHQINIKDMIWYHPSLDDFDTVHDRCLAFDSLLHNFNTIVNIFYMKRGIKLNHNDVWKQLVPFCGRHSIQFDDLNIPNIKAYMDVSDGYSKMRKPRSNNFSEKGLDARTNP